MAFMLQLILLDQQLEVFSSWAKVRLLTRSTIKLFLQLLFIYISDF